VGLYLAWTGGWVVILAGSASILAALAYSGGPYPLASSGLGDLFVFIFFGPVAVCGTYYAQALEVTAIVALIALPVGLLITAILVVKNLRDFPTDRKAGKRTLAVILSGPGTVVEYLVLVCAAYGALPVIWTAGKFSAWVLLPLVSLPAARSLVGWVATYTGARLNLCLAGTARLSVVFSLLLSMGMLVHY
jgi:1,4-dihydroxy-2-naphthoate octaprenyltransferase